ncbi:MAG: hypothetical protein GOMPHAMPRED_006938 [Gomphillus americanus]|uniref:DUF1754-domain-containing protein n=1 Tax=Gomphillus americanus TaxID=1940652 RepID=A0A8H3I0D6_9LECA|nr:MAG: hypothetical protein GOMPHAMPRED_006938 [Gomphillus americanus]
MPSEDYSTASRGALKIKGVQGSRIDKSKKKKKAKHAEGGGNSADQKSDIAQGKQKSLADALADEDEKDKELSSPGSNMTEAERQSYERRYKMLEERLKKEGIKSHKERVESLNRYLSSLSEHHDMPRIGPG